MATGCSFGHPGCDGGAACPGAGGGAPGFGGTAGGRRFPNVRSQIFFVDPPGMRIGWQTAGGPGADRVYLPAQLTVPARYNFNQGYIYRLKLTDIPNHPGLMLYPTIEVAPSTPATDAYLTHNPIPAQFTQEDFDQVIAGNFVTKVIYLPDPKFQELAIAGVETLVSTRLEPGVDPILEADRRGTILMIVRMGAIDLEMPNPTGEIVIPGSVVDSAPIVYPGEMSGGVLPPGTLPEGAAPFAPVVAPPTAPPITESVPLDAPVSPAPAPATAPETEAAPAAPADLPGTETPPVVPPPNPAAPGLEDPLAVPPGLEPNTDLPGELPPVGEAPGLNLP